MPAAYRNFCMGPDGRLRAPDKKTRVQRPVLRPRYLFSSRCWNFLLVNCIDFHWFFTRHKYVMESGVCDFRVRFRLTVAFLRQSACRGLHSAVFVTWRTRPCHGGAVSVPVVAVPQAYIEPCAYLSGLLVNSRRHRETVCDGTMIVADKCKKPRPNVLLLAQDAKH